VQENAPVLPLSRPQSPLPTNWLILRLNPASLASSSTPSATVKPEDVSILTGTRFMSSVTAVPTPAFPTLPDGNATPTSDNNNNDNNTNTNTNINSNNTDITNNSNSTEPSYVGSLPSDNASIILTSSDIEENTLQYVEGSTCINSASSTTPHFQHTLLITFTFFPHPSLQISLAHTETLHSAM
jgi:hypothetical protein